MTVLHLIHLKNTPIFEQLQLEEALLRTDQRNWCIVNEGSPSAIVMGISGKPEELIHEEKLSVIPVPVIRRFSGGGTVFVDQNTFFVTFICNASCIGIPPFPEAIMRWTEELYRPLFLPHPFQLRENDYTIEEKKFGGNAQSICKHRWLHHSSLLWDYDSSNMEYLKIPNKAPNYRLKRSHDEFLCRLQDYWPKRDLFQEALLDHLRSHFDVIEVKKEQVEDVLQRPHRKATSFVKTTALQ